MQLTHCSCVYIANPTENSASLVEILVRLAVYERLAQLIELIGSAIFTKLSQLCESYTQTVLGQSIIADSVDKRLTYQTHIDQTIMKCERLIRMLYLLMSRNSYLSIQNKILIYKLYFRPIFCYASPIWVNCANVHFLKLQRLQNKILKMIFNVHWRTSTSFIHRISNINMLRPHITNLNNNFWNRCRLNSDIEIAQIFQIAQVQIIIVLNYSSKFFVYIELQPGFSNSSWGSTF